MKVLITLRDIENRKRVGGITHYYRSLRPYLGSDFVYFTLGKREGSRGWRDDWKRLFSDYFRFWKETAGVNLVNLNPSLGRAGLFRDGLHLVLAKLRRRKVVVFFRGWSVSAEKAIDRWGSIPFRTVFGRADGMIVLSGAFKEKLRAWGYKGPVWVETTTVSEQLLEQVALDRGRDERCRMLFLARIERDKGIYEALEAQEKLAKRGVRSQLIVVGDGSERVPAERWANERKIPGVTFCGYLVGSRKAAMLNSADLYLFPSTHGEGMPNSVLEAMAFGLPVVATPVGGLSGFFEDQKMGVRLSDIDPENLANQLQPLVENPGLRAEIGTYNAEYARRHFVAGTVAHRLKSIWREVFEPSEKQTGQTWQPQFSTSENRS